MTKAEALRVILNLAGQKCAGVGQGISTLPSRDEQARACEAARKLWPSAFTFDCTDNALRNIGFRP